MDLLPATCFSIVCSRLLPPRRSIANDTEVSPRTTPNPPAYTTLSSAPTNQFTNQIPPQASSTEPSAQNSPHTATNSTDTASAAVTQTEHHVHHHHHHHNYDESGPSSSQHIEPSSAIPAPPKSKRKQSRKHSHQTRRPSHKGPLLDLNDPALTAPGSNGRPFIEGGETRPLTANGTGTGTGTGTDRPGMIQYGSVYYYPMARQGSVVEQEYETQGRRMFLLAVVAVVVVMAVLALSKADESRPDRGWR